MRRRERPLPEGDDGRTVVNMNVEGMPWYAPERSKAKTSPGSEGMTREQMGFFTWGALKAALLVVGVICGFLILFVLFCQFVWFR